MNTIIHIIEQLRWNQLVLKIIHTLNLVKKLIDKDSRFKVGDHVRFQNIKTFLLKDALQASLEKFL